MSRTKHSKYTVPIAQDFLINNINSIINGISTDQIILDIMSLDPGQRAVIYVRYMEVCNKINQTTSSIKRDDLLLNLDQQSNNISVSINNLGKIECTIHDIEEEEEEQLEDISIPIDNFEQFEQLEDISPKLLNTPPIPPRKKQKLGY
jgi:aryl-phospho-beta-D-glucosidase BglC (GH1 family)